MATSPVEALKEKLDIVDVLKEYLTLTPAGKNFKARCPFHREKTPSFMVSPDRQTWHCFGCGLGGDMFAFVMRHDNIEFADALKVLADKAGIELKRVSPLEYKYFGLLYDINADAKKFFISRLEGSDVAKKYLLGRKLSPATAEEFELGFATSGPDELTMHLMNLGYAPDDCVRSGVTIKTERGRYLDRFRGRIMFPIHNHLGKVVGFTGRILPEFDTGEMGKYVNSPETPIFQKSKLLYGFWKSKNSIREEKIAVLVEGQMDFLALWQVGIKNVIATSGTAMTAEHLKSIVRLTDQLVLFFDSDEAGQAALERAIDLAEAADFRVRVATLKDDKDPADAALRDAETVKSAIGKAVPAQQFYFARYLPASATGKKGPDFLRQLRAVLQKIKFIASPVERSMWLSELAKLTGLGEAVLIEEAEKIPMPESSGETAPEIIKEKDSRQRSRWELLSEELLAAMVGQKRLKEAEDAFQYLSPASKEAFSILKSGEKKSLSPNLDSILNLIMLRAELPEAHEKLEPLMGHLKKEYFKERRQELSKSIKQAEAEGNETRLSSLLQELNGLPKL
jgi:DNA primase